MLHARATLTPTERPPENLRLEENGVLQRIRLRGINSAAKGRVWESTSLLRAGRIESVEISLNDESVSRRHAELRLGDGGWRLTDQGSTNGTFLNGVRLGPGHWPVRVRDLIQFGDIALVVEALEGEPIPQNSKDQLRVEATARASWEDALSGLAYDNNRCPRPGEQLLVLVRAGHHLGHLENEEELLQSILNDAVAVLDAQRGAIVLAEGPEENLRPRALVSGRNEPRATAAGRSAPSSRAYYSQSLAMRSYERGESILCHSSEDPELAIAQSIAEGAMASVLCVLLRTPRRKLGVLHLDRGPWQKPFTIQDLHLADALAANVSAGIESAQLLQKQRQLFRNTLTILAQAVELRDEYTGGHTKRVTEYAVLLGKQMEISAAQIDLLETGTPLHDIGKIGIDDAILRKPDKLTPAEFEEMKKHTTKGAKIVEMVPELHPILPIVRSHHERWDGAGYPDQLAGEAISPLARIVAVADAFDAMTSDRSYRKGMPADAAFGEVQKQTGRQFDPRCAHAFLAIRDQVLALMPEPTASHIQVTRAVKALREKEFAQ